MLERAIGAKKVLIIQAQMKQYRVPFFDRLHRGLKVEGVDLKVAYSAPNDSEASKADNADLPTEYGFTVKAYWLFGNRVLYQPLLREIWKADLVVVEQANKHLLNHLLLLLSALGIKNLAFWGLGENKQEDRSALSEFYKRLVMRRVDWWFAYTAGAATYVASHGMPPEKITAVQNAVDTSELQYQLLSLRGADILDAREMLGIGERDPVGLFCGSLDRVKGVPFLLEAAKRVREQLPNFHLVIAGGGGDRKMVEEIAQRNDWIHYVGPVFGAQKTLLLKLADVMLQPGRIGLVVLDAFAAGLPLITVRIRIHGPEAEYIEDGVNGLFIEYDVQIYAQAVRALLEDASRLAELKAGALRSAGQYTIEKMAERFKDGIVHCLNRESGILGLPMGRLN